MGTWTNIIFLVPSMCTQLNGFAQRSLYFLHFRNVLRLFWRKRGIKEGFFWGLRPGFRPPRRGLRCIHPSAACKPEPLPGGRVWLQGVRFETENYPPTWSHGSVNDFIFHVFITSTQSVLLLDGAPMKDAGRCYASYVYFPPTAESVSTYHQSLYNKLNFVQHKFLHC